MISGGFLFPSVKQGYPIVTSDNSTTSTSSIGSPGLSQPKLFYTKKEFINMMSKKNISENIENNNIKPELPLPIPSTIYSFNYSKDQKNDEDFHRTNLHSSSNHINNVSNGKDNMNNKSYSYYFSSSQKQYSNTRDDVEMDDNSRSPSYSQPTNTTPKIHKTTHKTPSKRYFETYGTIYSLAGESACFEYNINRRNFSIGSKRENDLLIPSSTRKTYALITIDSGVVTLTALTRYTIKINGLEMIQTSYDLQDGDHIKIKNSVLLFRTNKVNNNNNFNNFYKRDSSENPSPSPPVSPKIFSNNTTPTHCEQPPFKPTTTTTTTTTSNPYKIQTDTTQPQIHKTPINYSLFDQLKNHQKNQENITNCIKSNNINQHTNIYNHDNDNNKQLATIDYIYKDNIIINLNPKNNLTDYTSYLTKNNIYKPNRTLFKEYKFQIIRSKDPFLSDLIELHGGQVLCSNLLLDVIKIYPKNTFFDYMKQKSRYWINPCVNELWISDSIQNNKILSTENYQSKIIRGSPFHIKKFTIYPPEYDFNLLSCQFLENIKSCYHGSGQSKYKQLKKDFEREIIHFGGKVVPFKDINISKTTYILVLNDIPDSEIVKLNSYKLVTVKWLLDCKEKGTFINNEYYKKQILLGSK